MIGLLFPDIAAIKKKGVLYGGKTITGYCGYPKKVLYGGKTIPWLTLTGFETP